MARGTMATASLFTSSTQTRHRGETRTGRKRVTPHGKRTEIVHDVRAENLRRATVKSCIQNFLSCPRTVEGESSNPFLHHACFCDQQSQLQGVGHDLQG